MSETHASVSTSAPTSTFLKDVLDRILLERKNQRCFVPMVSHFRKNDDDLVK